MNYDDYKLSNPWDDQKFRKCSDCGMILEDGEDEICDKCKRELEWLNPEDLEDDNEPFID